MGEIIHKTPIRQGSISLNPENLRPVQNSLKFCTQSLSVVDWHISRIAYPSKVAVSVVNELNMARLNHRKLYIEKLFKIAK
jgi:hypothetical protein